MVNSRKRIENILLTDRKQFQKERERRQLYSKMIIIYKNHFFCIDNAVRSLISVFFVYKKHRTILYVQKIKKKNVSIIFLKKNDCKHL